MEFHSVEKGLNPCGFGNDDSELEFDIVLESCGDERREGAGLAAADLAVEERVGSDLVRGRLVWGLGAGVADTVLCGTGLPLGTNAGLVDITHSSLQH